MAGEAAPLYGNPIREVELSDGSIIRFKRPCRAALTQAHEVFVEELQKLLEATGDKPDDRDDEQAEKKPDNRTDEERMFDSRKYLDRGIILFDALESWTHSGRCVFGTTKKEPLTREMLEEAPEAMLVEARDAVWRAKVDYELRHRKN